MNWIIEHREILMALASVGLLFCSAALWLLWQQKVQAYQALNSQFRELERHLADERSNFHSQLQRLQLDHASQTAKLEQLAELKTQLSEKEHKLAELQTALTRAEAKFAELRATSEANTKHQQAQLELLASSKQQLKQEFNHLANEIFEKKQQQFSTASQQSLHSLLEPFRQQMNQFRQRIDDIHSRDAEGRGQLSAQLKQLGEMNNLLNKQASDLTKALKGEKKLQGNWGELQIERILETSGLQKGREYEREASFKDSEGQHKRPDFVVYLPQGKHLIIDSKVSLVAYQQAVAAETDSERDAAIREHVSATRAHIRSLSDKNYSSLGGINSPDFVLMFMPVESAFVTAFEADPKLFNDAFERQIVVVTPTTLLATLKTVANLWVLERQNENAKELFTLAGKIYDKIAIFGRKMDKLQGQLEGAEKSFHDAMSTLTTGRGSVVSYVKRLKDKGAPASKELPDSLISAGTEQRDFDDTEA